MAVLPEVSEILLELDTETWRVAAFELVAHGGETLATLRVADLPDEGSAALVAGEVPLEDRLGLVAMILDWVDDSDLPERDGRYVIQLPSPDHVPDAVPDGRDG